MKLSVDVQLIWGSAEYIDPLSLFACTIQFFWRDAEYNVSNLEYSRLIEKVYQQTAEPKRGWETWNETVQVLIETVFIARMDHNDKIVLEHRMQRIASRIQPDLNIHTNELSLRRSKQCLGLSKNNVVFTNYKQGRWVEQNAYVKKKARNKIFCFCFELFCVSNQYINQSY